jgi:hypothetical protein
MMLHHVLLGFALAKPAEDRAYVVVEPPMIDEEISASDRETLLVAVRRGLASTSYTLVPEDHECRTRGCRESIEHKRRIANRVDIEIQADARSYDVTLRARRAGENEAFATTSGRCDICGIAELEQLVASKADALRRRLATQELAPAVVAVTSTPAGATVWIDGRKVGTTPFEGEVKPGPHEVEVEAPGHFGRLTRMTASRGVAERHHFALAPMPKRRVPVALAATSVVLGIGAIAGGATMLALHGREIDRRCGPDTRDADGDCQWVHRTRGGGIAMTLAGVALAGTGVTLLLLERRRPRPSELRAMLSPRHVALSLSF